MIELDDFPWDNAATWTPDVVPRAPHPQHAVTLLVPAGADPERMWSLHIVAALLEQRCPHCYGLLVGNAGADDDGHGWRLCPQHGWWLRDPQGWRWQRKLDEDVPR